MLENENCNGAKILNIPKQTMDINAWENAWALKTNKYTSQIKHQKTKKHYKMNWLYISKQKKKKISQNKGVASSR